MYLQALLHSSYFMLLTSNTIVECHITLQAGVPSSNMLPNSCVAWLRLRNWSIDQIQIGGQLYLMQQCVVIDLLNFA